MQKCVDSDRYPRDLLSPVLTTNEPLKVREIKEKINLY